MVASTVVQAAGRTRAVALLQLAEIVPFLALLVVATERWGIEGAAYAWTARAILDVICLLVLSQQVAPLPPSLVWTVATMLALIALLGMLAPVTPVRAAPAALALSAAALTLTVVVWVTRTTHESVALHRGVR
jgi:O-antigen/teichoic acid export membrane protein